MNFVADESTDYPLVLRLRRDGHDVISIHEQSPSVTDDFILTTSAADDRIVITADKDFGELVYRLGRANAGVILIRLAGLTNTLKQNVTSTAIRQHESELRGAFTVIEAGRIRIRRAGV